jgi:hypothetical protein
MHPVHLHAPTKVSSVGTRVHGIGKVDPHIDDPFPGWHRAEPGPKRPLEQAQLQVVQTKWDGEQWPPAAAEAVCFLSCSAL